jgi:aminopeptidase N
MSSDNLEATEKVTKVLVQAKSQMPDNPQIKMMISQMLKDGLNKKMEVLKNNPNSPTINRQIDAINKSIEAFK